jgi:hypothetical protein
MKNIKKISYQYTRDYRNPINYQIQTDTVTTTLSYNDAMEIAYAVIDSLGGSYDYLDELVEKFDDEENYKMEAI